MQFEDSDKLSYASEIYRSGRIDEAISLYKRIVAETRSINARFLSAREIVRIYSGALEQNPNFLVAGTNEGNELHHYLKIVVESHPHVNPDIQRQIPIDEHRQLLKFFQSENLSGINESAMQRVADDLMNLKQQYEKGHVIIAGNREQVLAEVRNGSLRKDSEFSIDDSSILNKVRQLAASSEVVISFDPDRLKNEVYYSGSPAKNMSPAWVNALGVLAAIVTFILSFVMAASIFSRSQGMTLIFGGCCFPIISAAIAYFTVTFFINILRKS